MSEDLTANAAMPFDEWMRRALFDPQRGYYSRNIGTVGRRGDFSTSATLNTALGEAMAGWLKQMLKVHRGVGTIIEVGAGDGSLMHVVRRSLGWLCRMGLCFHIVEISPALRERQRSKLGGGRVQWFADLASALDACNGRALIYHNEVLDAFPVSLLRWDAASSAWQEVWLAQRGGVWSETWRDLTMNENARAGFSVFGSWPSLSDGQRCELGTGACQWLRTWASHWKEGAMLAIDYGDVFPHLYHRRPQGTLRAYLAHQCASGAQIYANMGRQDITADVNFTDLMRQGEALGWRAEPLMTQREFLQRHLPGFNWREAADRGVSFVADGDGAGSAFKVLIEHRSWR